MEQSLKEKIKSRARRAFEAPTEKHHRITEVTENSLMYRLPHQEGESLYSGKKVLVKKDKLGRLKIVE